MFESVAQVLLSRSRGLVSRFQQLVSKTDAEVTHIVGFLIHHGVDKYIYMYFPCVTFVCFCPTVTGRARATGNEDAA